ncbi:hypothetical protein MP228_000671 [Amoeboaphelidium protococcarum]|nr:hypothetical protein MP228_000671 [Amoeboaphelidium protococcarum]
MTMQNINPLVNDVKGPFRQKSEDDMNPDVEDQIDSLEVFDLIRDINDPEHPLTLEQLNVVTLEQIVVRRLPESDDKYMISIDFTPTIPHCSMATLIGLAIRVKLQRSLARNCKVSVNIREGTHQSEVAINKQLNDKERVAAAIENPSLSSVVNQCIARSVLVSAGDI